jgi:hypothetical protein
MTEAAQSGALGEGEDAYGVARSAAVLGVVNRRQVLTASFGRGGVRVRAGGGVLGFWLRGYRRGSRVAPLALVEVSVGYTKPKNAVLPPISDVRIDQAQQRITGQLTNPYSNPKPSPAPIPATATTPRRPSALVLRRFVSGSIT